MEKYSLRIFLFGLLLQIGYLSSFSQANIKWNDLTGGTGSSQGNYDEGTTIKPTSDGGFIIAGNTNSSDGDVPQGTKGGADVWVVKISSTGVIQWQKTFGGTNEDKCNAINLAADGGYILTGYSFSFNGDVTTNKGQSDVWVIKLSSNGDLQWQKTFGGRSQDGGQSVLATPDGYLVAGYTFSNEGDVTTNKGQSDVWLIKLDNNGQLQWQKTFGGTNLDQANAIDVSIDGGFLLTGYTYSNNGDVSGNKGQQDVWVVKVNTSGVLQWQRTFGGSSNDQANTIAAAADGNIFITGSTMSNDGDVSGNKGGLDIWTVKLNSSGILQWQKCLGGTDSESGYGILPAADGTSFITGYTASKNGDVTGNAGLHEMWVVKLSSTGMLLWQNCLGGSASEAGFSVTATTDNAYLMVGRTNSNDIDVSGNKGGTDLWLVKLSNSNAVVWQKCLGGMITQAINVNNHVKKTIDDGIITAGFSNSNALPGHKGKEDFLVTRYNAGGNIIWQKVYGGSETDIATSVVTTIDSGYVIGGYTISDDSDISDSKGGYDGWIVKLDSSGILQWQVSLGGTDDDYINSLSRSADGGFVVVGSTSSIDGEASGNHGLSDFWVVKINSLGEVIWKKCFGGTDNEEAYAISNTTDNNYIITGYTSSEDNDVSGNNGVEDMWVIKINESGGLLWQKCIGGSNNERGKAVTNAPDGGYVFAGSTFSNDMNVSGNNGSEDVWIVKLNSNGTLQWQKCLGGSNIDAANGIIASPEGGYTIVGFTQSSDKNVSGFKGIQDLWLVNINGSGVLQWQKCMGGTLYESGESIAIYDDGNYAVTGSTASSDGDLLTVNSSLKSSSKGWTMALNNCPAAFISANDPTVFCEGGNIMLNANSGNGFFYQWKKDGVKISDAISPTYNATVSGVYTVAITNSSGCTTNSANFPVTVNALPAKPIITPQSALTFCSGGYVVLSATKETGFNYQWKRDQIVGGITSSSEFLTFNPGVFSVSLISNNGCVSPPSDPVTVTVNPLPDVTITASGPNDICNGASLTLSVVKGTNFVYQWENNDIPINLATGSSYNVLTDGYYSVSVTNNFGCTAVSDAYAVTVKPVPAKPTINVNAGTLISSSTINNQWYLNNLLIPGATAQRFTPSANGSYTVRVTGINGCESPSSDAIAYVYTAVGQVSNDLFISIFPNPFVQNQNIKVDWKTILLNKSIRLTVYDLNGKVMFQNTYYYSPADLVIPGPPGIYFVEVLLSNKQRKLFKLIKSN